MYEEFKRSKLVVKKPENEIKQVFFWSHLLYCNASIYSFVYPFPPKTCRDIKISFDEIPMQFNTGIFFFVNQVVMGGKEVIFIDFFNSIIFILV
jgi:hypothetical protein